MKQNFNDAEQFERLEDMAIDGQLDYQDFPPEEYQYFSRLARLGYLNRHKGWSADICEQKQEEYREQYDKHCENRDARFEHMRELQRTLITGTDLLRRLELTGSIHDALRLALRYIELTRGEEGIEWRVLNHIKETYT